MSNYKLQLQLLPYVTVMCIAYCRAECFKVLNFSISSHSVSADVLNIDLLDGCPSQTWNVHIMISLINFISVCCMVRGEIVNEIGCIIV